MVFIVWDQLHIFINYEFLKLINNKQTCLPFHIHIMKRYSIKETNCSRLINSLPHCTLKQEMGVAEFNDHFISKTPKTSLGKRTKIIVIRQDLLSEEKERSQSKKSKKIANQIYKPIQSAIYKHDEYCIKSKKSKIQQPVDWLHYFAGRPSNEILWMRNSQKVKLEQIDKPCFLEQIQLHENFMPKKQSLIRVRVMNSVNQSRDHLTYNKIKEMKSKTSFTNLQNPQRQKERLEPWILREQTQHEQHLFRKALRKCK